MKHEFAELTGEELVQQYKIAIDEAVGDRETALHAELLRRLGPKASWDHAAKTVHQGPHAAPKRK